MKYFIALIIVVVGVFGLEKVAEKKLLKLNPNYGLSAPYNRSLHPNTLLSNTPNFETSTYLYDDSVIVDVTDGYGFFAGEKVDYVKKDSNVYRIFLNGGSGAMGSGQVYLYDSIHSYPYYLYNWEISIAGFLKNKLSKQFPNKKIEVINTATYTRTFHESYLLYLSKLAFLQPDLIIQIDGFNDLNGFLHNNPYKIRNELFFKPTLYQTFQAVKFTKSAVINLFLYYIIDQIRTSSLNFEYNKKLIKDFDLQDYFAVKGEIKKNATGLQKVIDHYSNSLKNDSIPFIFALQPMLHNWKNKKLSPTEIKFRDNIDFFEPSESSQKYINFDYIEDNYDINAYFDKQKMCLAYCWQDFFSDDFESIVTANNGTYIDFNREIAPLGPEVEFYTDFCHYTAQGNDIISQILFEEIIENHLNMVSEE